MNIRMIGVLELSPEMSAFLTERHLATLTIVRADGSPHVTPVGFSFDRDDGLVRVITRMSSIKARHAATGGRAAVCQVDGHRWATLEGVARLVQDPDSVARAVAAYAERYREPARRSDRVAIEIVVDRVMGSV